MRFLSRRQLEGLKQYQYKASGYTILDDLHNPIWTWLVNLLPMWLAPNLITLMATACIAAAYAINVVYLPDFAGAAPPWMYLATAVSVVAYVNLDCMDGKQARRTGSSSPLGQLFDHGCDALALHMILGNIAASLGVPCSWKMAAGCMGILVPWILAQWEEYHTGVMMYGTRLYGVLEANYSICAVHMLTYFMGPGMWATRVALPAALHGVLGSSASIADLSLAGVSAAGLAQAWHNIYRVLIAPSITLPQQERGRKQLGRGAAVGHLLSISVVLALGMLLLHQAEGQGAYHGRLAFSTFGVLYAMMATQLIIAHMCKEPLQPPWLAAGLLLVACASSSPVVVPLLGLQSIQISTLVCAVACVSVSCYLTFVLAVIQQICSFLGIRVLSIKPAAAGPAAMGAAGKLDCSTAGVAPAAKVLRNRAATSRCSESDDSGHSTNDVLEEKHA